MTPTNGCVRCLTHRASSAFPPPRFRWWEIALLLALGLVLAPLLAGALVWAWCRR